eukprot:364399-Chlamydomonas_euryale.AAC.2
MEKEGEMGRGKRKEGEEMGRGKWKEGEEMRKGKMERDGGMARRGNGKGGGEWDGAYVSAQENLVYGWMGEWMDGEMNGGWMCKGEERLQKGRKQCWGRRGGRVMALSMKRMGRQNEPGSLASGCMHHTAALPHLVPALLQPTGQAVVERAATGQAVAVVERAATGQAVVERAATGQAVVERAATGQAVVERAATGQAVVERARQAYMPCVVLPHPSQRTHQSTLCGPHTSRRLHRHTRCCAQQRHHPHTATTPPPRHDTTPTPRQRHPHPAMTPPPHRHTTTHNHGDTNQTLQGHQMHGRTHMHRTVRHSGCSDPSQLCTTGRQPSRLGRRRVVQGAGEWCRAPESGVGSCLYACKRLGVAEGAPCRSGRGKDTLSSRQEL